MKILCINTNGLHNDGITNSILNYYKNMDKSSIVIDLLQTKEVDRKTVQCVKDTGLGLKYTAYRRYVPLYIIKTAWLIYKEHYDIVHIHGSSSILAIDLMAAWLGRCKVRIAHSRNTTCTHIRIDRLLRPIFYKLCTERFACGEDAGKWLFGNHSFTIIKNGKDFDQFRFRPETRHVIRKKYSWKNKIVLGHVGNFNYQKNHEFLLNVFAELRKDHPEYQLVLMGTGTEYLDKAKKQTGMLGIQDSVMFMGSVSNVGELLQAMDIMLLPSHFEGLPNVVLEWQIAGLPSLISDKITRECSLTSLVRYLPIDHGVEIWANAIRSIPNNPDRQELSLDACKRMAEAGYDIKENAKYLKKQYECFIKRGNSRAVRRGHQT